MSLSNSRQKKKRPKAGNRAGFPRGGELSHELRSDYAGTEIDHEAGSQTYCIVPRGGETYSESTRRRVAYLCLPGNQETPAALSELRRVPRQSQEDSSPLSVLSGSASSRDRETKALHYPQDHILTYLCRRLQSPDCCPARVFTAPSISSSAH